MEVSVELRRRECGICELVAERHRKGIGTPLHRVHEPIGRGMRRSRRGGIRSVRGAFSIRSWMPARFAKCLAGL